MSCRRCEARQSAHDRPTPLPSSSLQPGVFSSDAGTPGAVVLQKIIGLGDEVDYDEERRVGSELQPLRDQTSGLLTIYPLSRDDLTGKTFEDIALVPRTKRWVPHDGSAKVVAYEVPKTAPAMQLQLTFPPHSAAGVRSIRVFAKFGGTELTVRAEVLVGGVVVPAYSKEVPITYPA